MKETTKKEQTLSSFLQTLDLNELGLPTELAGRITQIGSAIEDLGLVRQKMMEKKLGKEVSQFDKVLEKEVKKNSTKETTLFPNTIPPEKFAISSAISDPHAKLISANKDILSYYHNNGKIISVTINQKAIKFGNKMIEPSSFIESQEFLELMNGWLDPKTIQHWCVLWNWVCENQTFILPYVPLSNLLKTVYTPSKDGKFSMKVRKSFSTSLTFYHNATIEIPVIVEILLPNGKKKKEEAVKLIRLVNLDLAKKNKKGDVYLKVTGEVLPGLNPGKYRGRIFPKGIFELDANREGHRIKFAYRLCNRFDQMNGEPLEWSVPELINAAGLEKTYNIHKGKGCFELTRTLNRLIDVQCIEAIDPKKITASLVKPVKIYSTL